MALSSDTSILKPVQNNVNLSSLSSPATTKRLTMVEKARLEALASFGNNGLDTLSFKKTDLRSKLKCTAINTENKSENFKPLTRMEKARIEANNAFKNVQLGQLINKPQKRKIQHSNEGENLKKQKQISLTRIQKAKQEAEKAFENVSLDKIPPKRSKLEKEKMENKLLKGKKKSTKSEVKKITEFQSSQPGSKPVIKSSKAPDKVPEVRYDGVNTPKRLTRSKSTKIKSCVNGARAEASGDEIMSMKNVERKLTKNDEEKTSNSDEVAMETAHDDISNFTSQSYQHNNINNGAAEGNGQKRLTRLERAKLEALRSFKGQEFSDICKQSMRIVAKHLRPKKDQACNTENEEFCETPMHASELFEDEQKCKESFHSKVALLKGSETPINNPTTNQQLKKKRAKADVYSSIIEDFFKDQSSLLETSRRVVKTAIELETPEGSPMSTTTL